MGLARNLIRSNCRPLSRPIVPPSPVTRVYADFGPIGKSVSFFSVTPDRIVMFVYPRAGNAGLPAGAPAVTNDRFQTIDFAYSGGALTSIGSGFNGFIANIQLFSGSTLLLDEPVNNNDGLTYNNFQSDDIRSFTQNADGDWLGGNAWNTATSTASGVVTKSGDQYDFNWSGGAIASIADNGSLTVGRMYRLQFTVSSYVVGNIAESSIVSGFDTINLSAGNGIYTFTGAAVNTNANLVRSGFTGQFTFSNIEYREFLEIA